MKVSYKVSYKGKDYTLTLKEDAVTKRKRVKEVLKTLALTVTPTVTPVVVVYIICGLYY